MEIWKSIIEWVGNDHLWVLQVFTVVFLTLVAAMAARSILQRLLARAEITHNLWDDALIGAARQPLRLFIWLIGLTVAGQVALSVSDSGLLELVEPLRRIGVVALLAWFLVRFIRRAEINLIDPGLATEPMDATTVHAIGKLLRISVIITAALVLLQSLGYSISGVLAFGGIGGIAVGFAAKDLLANFFGGLMIYLDRPFSVGDWIRSPDQEIEGTVEDIGWRLTRIRTFDKRPLYIPNATFAHISVENPSRMTHRRIHETIGVRYDDAAKVEELVVRVRRYLVESDDIDHSQTLIVNLNTFGPSSLDFFIYTFTRTTNWIEYHQVKQKVLLDVLAIIDECGAECAFPTSTLHVASLPAGTTGQV